MSSAHNHYDVLIIGAGISGIGSAYYLQNNCSGKSFVILEGKEDFGGTWRTHTYPGIRSDSDLHTFGYSFKPWTSAPIATADEILKYVGEVIDENDIGPHIRYGHWIKETRWSSEHQTWTVEGIQKDIGDPFIYTCNFLWMCQGYYRHSEGYTPKWEGMETYRGQIVHPQTWPEDLKYRNKNVLVIGSGTTTATLVPAIAEDCAHVTVLQRSPTFYSPGRNAIPLAEELRRLEVDEAWIHEIVRRQIIVNQREFTKRAREQPEEVRPDLLKGVKEHLPEGYDVDTHFTPSYRPWRQRLAFVPNGDFFESIKAGHAIMVTDHIDRFTECGVLLESGRKLDADIIVTATGFNLCVMGDIGFSIDDEPVDFAKTITYRGTMFTGVPNMAWVFGYFRASWTLRVDLIGDLVCRLLNHMDAKGFRSVCPQLRPEEADMPILPWIDSEDFNPNYLMRAIDQLPKRGDKPEWQHTQDYWIEKNAFPEIDLDDPAFRYR